MTFPTAGSRIYRNEEGEVVGWDNPSYDDPPEPDPGDDWGPEPYDGDDGCVPTEDELDILVKAADLLGENGYEILAEQLRSAHEGLSGD